MIYRLNRISLNLLLIIFGLSIALSCSQDVYTPYEADQGLDPKFRETSDWYSYAGKGSTRSSDLTQIDIDNVDDLKISWIFRSGDVSDGFQTTPIISNGALILCTPNNKVVALDPLLGTEIWRYDPSIPKLDYANKANCRGVAQWNLNKKEKRSGRCDSVIYLATNDARLIALDARDGNKCNSFGQQGEIDLKVGVGKHTGEGDYQVTSPPAVISNVVVVGSAISDNERIDAPSGVVRGYDVNTGELVWAFDLAPPGFNYQTGMVSEAGYALGTPNVWAGFAVDEERDIIFLPTGNPSPDYFRDLDIDMGFYGSSVVALKGSTGDYLWHFKTVIKDFWDFDVPSIPSLIDIDIDGIETPALIQSTKMGFIFILNRETGEPLIDISYEEVPTYGPLKNQLSNVQPFPPKAFRVSREYKRGDSVFQTCRNIEKKSKMGTIYTPITEDWTLGLPSNMGAMNWGGISVDPKRGLIGVRINNVAFRTKLISKAKLKDFLYTDVGWDPERNLEDIFLRPHQFNKRLISAVSNKFDIDLDSGIEYAEMKGTDYILARYIPMNPFPCAGVPFAELLVIDIKEKKHNFRRSHGLDPVVGLNTGIDLGTGYPGVGGSLITSGGLLFVGGSSDKMFRAHSVDSGEVLWEYKLPFSGNATPMSYEVQNESGQRIQMVVIAAGGDILIDDLHGDYLIAFALPD